jgi:hypothetical protein
VRLLLFRKYKARLGPVKPDEVLLGQVSLGLVKLGQVRPS